MIERVVHVGVGEDRRGDLHGADGGGHQPRVRARERPLGWGRGAGPPEGGERVRGRGGGRGEGAVAAIRGDRRRGGVAQELVDGRREGDG